uniref:DegT/DnrJ/EryC1/StrS family aminotransferase n=1 Tax=Prosthecobacter sp. TaxID=1965333 RepID=UPI003782F1C2
MTHHPASPLFPAFPHADQLHHQARLHEAMQRVFDSGRLILGAEVSAFESEFATFLGVKHVVGVGSGTDAIEVMLRALGIGPGSRVVVPAFAPSAVASGVMRSGAEVVFADIDKDTFTLCPDSLDNLLRSPVGRGVKAALVVHLYGHPADWLNLQRVANEHGITLLEDCAQAHGAKWHGRMTGTLGKMAAFSFYPTKNLAACGDAGAVATDDRELAERLRLIRQYGWRERQVSAIHGVNSRLDELQAALLRAKLPWLRESVNQRRRLAALYDARLGSNRRLTTPPVRGGCEHAFHQYVVRCERRDTLLRHLENAGIPVAVHYPVPLHQQPAFGANSTFPTAEAAAETVLSLPLHPHLSEEAVNAVCEVIETLPPSC